MTSSKKRVCVSISKDIVNDIPDIVKAFGFSKFVRACVKLYAKKNPFFLELVVAEICLNKGKKDD